MTSGVISNQMVLLTVNVDLGVRIEMKEYKKNDKKTEMNKRRAINRLWRGK